MLRRLLAVRPWVRWLDIAAPVCSMAVAARCQRPRPHNLRGQDQIDGRAL
eukprot:COSAG04_NODE_28633_length_274_cov_0.885714_1_plen_49_part_01